MKYLPHEITKTIVDHVGKYDDYLSRHELRNLRLVNKHFSQFATPILFQTVPFWLGLSSLEHLTLISEHPQISLYIKKLVFSPLRFVKWEDPSCYQYSVRNRFERDTFSHNVFSLSFGKHVAAYKGYLEAQDYLSTKSRDIKILTRALRRFPRLKNVTVVFKNETIGAREIMSAFGLLNGDEVTFDAEYTLPVLMEALSESDRELDTFNLLSNESSSCDLYCESRSSFNDKHEPRFEYVSESPAHVTSEAFWKAFQASNNKFHQTGQLMSRVRVFNMIGMEIGCDDLATLDHWSYSLVPLVAFAPHLEELGIMPSVNILDSRENQRLNLSYILTGKVRSTWLRFITLKYVKSPEPLLVTLFTESSRTLVTVKLLCVRITSGGRWSEVFRKLRNADFNVLYDFVLLHCGGAKGVARAQRYLKRITDKDPLAESNEKQSDD